MSNMSNFECNSTDSAPNEGRVLLYAHHGESDKCIHICVGGAVPHKEFVCDAYHALCGDWVNRETVAALGGYDGTLPHSVCRECEVIFMERSAVGGE